jgi:hypothetical protein
MVEHIVEEKKILRFVNTGFRVTHCKTSWQNDFYYTRVPGFSGIGRTREGTRLQDHIYALKNKKQKNTTLSKQFQNQISKSERGKIDTLSTISYIGFRQVIRAHVTCLCFIFPEPKAKEIYNTDRLYEPIIPV